jgi:ubiquinone/menaquinone biosynthesis C-methylase UbiE
MSKAPLQQQTVAHYDDHPFDFLTAEDEQRIEALQPRPFLQFANRYLPAGTLVAEIGCGPGRASLFLARRGVALTALDISWGSIQLARRRAPQCQFVRASALDLPFPAQSFPVVFSDGVIHHTPDPHKAFCELARILAPSGMLYVGVYRRKRYYYYVYTWLGKPIRWLEKHWWGKILINLTLLPLYYAVHLVKSRGKRTWEGAKNFFYDYIITPQATFHTKEEVEAWGQQNGLRLLDYDEHVGNVHAFVFQKKA